MSRETTPDRSVSQKRRDAEHDEYVCLMRRLDKEYPESKVEVSVDMPLEELNALYEARIQELRDAELKRYLRHAERLNKCYPDNPIVVPKGVTLEELHTLCVRKTEDVYSQQAAYVRAVAPLATHCVQVITKAVAEAQNQQPLN